jgi:hypothetical protein
MTLLLLSAFFIITTMSFCQRDLQAGEKALKLKQHMLFRSRSFGPFHGPTYAVPIRYRYFDEMFPLFAYRCCTIL